MVNLSVYPCRRYGDAASSPHNACPTTSRSTTYRTKVSQRMANIVQPSRKVVGNIVMSLDGYSSGPDDGAGGMGFLLEHATSQEPRIHSAGLWAASTTALLGRINYEGFGYYWPDPQGTTRTPTHSTGRSLHGSPRSTRWCSPAPSLHPPGVRTPGSAMT